MESKFGRSLLNKGTDNSGLALLLTDQRFQGIDLLIKRRILELILSRPFAVLLSFEEVQAPTRSKRIQFPGELPKRHSAVRRAKDVDRPSA
jgi:hypothetical protein